ncbi:hypothetical protein [Cupriavidus nantongensis]|uniref:hypothetical protein n=1 Tax=Cupriavidus nantongensis TaxID=1796606 RepID=UPI000A8A63F5|nr:hypothetical protein [Cupriavidus nantongensis]
MQYNRLTDNDRRFGPFDLGQRHTDWRPISLVLQSGSGEHLGCALIARAFGWTLRLRLPQIIKPFEIRHKAETWDAATIERMGRDWWAEVFPCEYGFSVDDGFLQVYLGPQTHDSLTTKSWCKHLPWTQWRFIRFSLFGLDGEHLRTWLEPKRRKLDGSGYDRFTQQREFEKTMPKAVFEIEDYDGKRIQATTHIEESEWRFGEGWFKWLSLFCRPKVRRSLSIDFDSEVGPEKGSWKGGLMGTGIDMLPGELHEEAFRRYCEDELNSKYRKYRITFVRRVDASAPNEGGKVNG